MARKRRPSGIYIKQAAQIVGVSPSILRSWETEGLISPARTDSGYRVYSSSDIERLRQLRDLIERGGLNPAGARLVLDESNGDSGTVDPGPERPHVSDRIRILRKRKGISLRKLAELSELSASSVSAIERGISAPSVGTLQRLAAALETTVPQLLDTARPRRNLVVRPHERQQLAMETPGVVFENLYNIDTTLQSILISVEPGHGSQESYSHEGEEFLYVMTGSLELTLNEIYSYRLGPGDAMTFQSTRPHRWHNPGEELATIVWVNTPPTF
ncbi:MAG: MerR family transcriptional regulator [Actinobacteria bacterium]|nr:MerR family transcriptional regulator [Actinomycetota bacterium]